MSVTISIVTPSYNQAAFIDETLRSVLSQREHVHEYFVYDGGSTDGSPDIIRRYAAGIDHWVSERDRGQSDAIARGFARATGEYVAWINSDDVYLPGALARARAALEAHPEWDVVSAWHVRHDAESKIRSCHRIPGESVRAARGGVFHPNQPTTFFRRSLYERVGGLNLDLHLVMDTELFFRMLDAGAVWGHIPAYNAAFRVHGDSKTYGHAAKYRSEFDYLNQRYPHYHAPTVRHLLGRGMHKARQWLSGREIAGLRDASRWRGRTVEEVFGRWVVSSPATPARPDAPAR
jgi:glycosyltransferase involved in cell wall biosynthesis